MLKEENREGRENKVIEHMTNMTLHDTLISLLSNLYQKNLDFAMEKSQDYVAIFLSKYKITLYKYNSQTCLHILPIDKDNSITLKDFTDLHNILKGI